MIIEMLLKINEDKTLVAAWEFPQSLWDSKKPFLKTFISDILGTQAVEFQEKKWQENIIFEIDAKPYQFYDIQNCFNDYFKSIGATVLVD